MFVETMTFEEIRKEFEKDKTPLYRKTKIHGEHIRKVMRKTNATRLNKYFEWLSPHKNRWTYHFDVDFKRPKTEDFLINQYCLFFTEKSYAVVGYAANEDQIGYFTSHFFTRYFQREHLPTENIHEIIRSFMNSNSEHVVQPLKHKYENEYDTFIQMKEGVAFGTLHHKLSLVAFRTYITNDMLKGDQIALSKSIEEEFRLGVVRKKEGGGQPPAKE